MGQEPALRILGGAVTLRRPAALAIGLALAAGCAGFPGAQPASSAPPPPDVQEQLFKLQKDAARILEQLEGVQKKAVDPTAACAEAASRTETIERQVRVVEEQLLATQRRLDEVLAEVRGLRPGAAPVLSPPRPPEGEVKAVPAGPAAGGAPAAATPSPAPSRPGPPTGTGSPTDLFNAAYSDYSRRHYELALAGFQAARQADPAGPMADDALYWTGETLYAMGRYGDAVSAYDTLIETFPKGEKTSAALLKKGLAQFEAKDNAAAVATLQALIRDYPNTDEARIAREHLRRRGALPA
ncbi:MAG: tetratricopeptide repeat protein [Acidobacteria bacterium]|nr:tetratricopeptide repeat protein [Acidobacteriota bacterium]